MDLIITKVVVAVLFGLLRMFFGLLPIKIYKCLTLWEKEDEGAAFINEKRHKQVNSWLALFQSFGGGVLFATCFLHMMPEVYKSMNLLYEYSEINTQYPYSQMIISIGFFVVYFVEETSHWLITRMGKKNRKKLKCFRAAQTPSNPKSNTPVENKVYPSEKNNHVYTINAEKNASEITYSAKIRKENLKNLGLEIESQTENGISNNKHSNGDISSNGKTSLRDYESDEADEVDKPVLEEVEHAKQLEKLMELKEKDQQQILRCCMVVLALSLHAIFEGLAIGLQISTSNIWYLFTAMTIHSATILFCIGLELLIAKTKIKTIFINIFILSVTSPFGVILGLIITLHVNMNTKAKSLAVVILEGFSAGTLLYITFFEVLNREKARRTIILTRAGFILGGFVLMALLEYIEIGK